MNSHRDPVGKTKIVYTIVPASESTRLREDQGKSGSGMTERLVSRHRPSHPIIALSPNEENIKRLSLSWGAIPIKVDKFEDTDDMIERAKRITVEMGFAKRGDKIVLTAGRPIGIPRNTNIIKIGVIE
jgi:pyruvate kinase